MVIICGTDEFIIGSVHEVPDLLDLSCYVVNELLRSYACVRSLSLDLLTVLVGSCLEVNVIALFSLVACDRVC